MKKLLLAIALCCPLIASASISFSICSNEFWGMCPQPSEISNTDISQEQAVEVAAQAIILAWDKSIPREFSSVATWIDSCEHISAVFSEKYDNWEVSYIFDKVTITIVVTILRNGQVIQIRPYYCGLHACMD